MRGQSYSNKKNNSNKEDFQGGETKVMKKSLKMLLVFALVFSMFAPAMGFAAEAEMDAQAKFDAMVEAGILEGIDGEAALDKNMQRNEVAKILANIFELEVVAGAPTPFPDEPADNWGYTDGYIQAVVASGLMIGGEKADGTIGFRPSAQLQTQELAVVLTRALGLELDAEATVEGKTSSWGTAHVAAVVAAGLLPASDDFTVDATRADLVSSTYEVYVAYEALKAAEEAAKALSVASVTATNLKSFTVVFNQAIDEDTLEMISVTDEDVTLNLMDDEMTVVVVFDDALSQSDSFELVIDGVKSVDGTKEVTEYEEEFTVNDVTVPVLLDATVLNHKQVELFFSEPVNFTNASPTVLNGVKLNGTSVIAMTTEYAATNSVIVEVPSLLANGTHTLEVSGVEDYAGFKIAMFETDVVVIEDTAAPVATGLEVKNISTIEVSFDEKLAAIGSFEVNGVSATAAYVADSNNTKVSLTAFGGLNLSAVVEVTVKYKGQKDIVGNEVKEWTSITTKVEDDTALPTATVSVGTGNKVTVTFSKSMLITDADGTIQVLNKDGIVHQAAFNVSTLATSQWKENNTKLELTAANLGLGDVNPAEYTLVIKGMNDATVRANLLPDQNIKFNALDTKNPTILGGYQVEAGTTGTPVTDNDTVTFYFSEAMDKDTLSNLSNYALNGVTPLSSIPAVTGASAAADGKSVTITYQNANVALSDPISVYALKDAAGNMLSTVSVAQQTVLDISITSVKATAKNEVEVEFGTAIKVADPSALKLQLISTGADDVVFISASISGDTVTFTTNKDLPNDTSNHRLAINNRDMLIDMYGSKLLVAQFGTIAVDVEDGIAPTASVASAVYDVNNGQTTVTVEFSENVTFVTTAQAAKVAFVLQANGNVIQSNDYSATYTPVAGTDKAKVEFVFTSTTDLLNKEVKVNYYGKDGAEAITDGVPANQLGNFESTKTVTAPPAP